MIFWFFIIALTATAVLSVLLPLAGSVERAGGGEEHDREVYLDQLAELERERSEGRIGAEEAEAARTEIARRLLAIDADAQATVPSGNSSFRRRFAAIVALVVLPLVAIVAYNRLGSPHLPAMPLQARMTAPDSGQDIGALVARVERHLAENPEDGQGWEVLGPVYMRLERPHDAVFAFGNAIRLLGATPQREASLGEAVAASEGGIITRPAREAFERALKLDPQSVRARFYLALAYEQEGDKERAIEAFRDLLADAPADAPWRSFAEQALARVGGATVAPGPTREQVADAEDMSDSERREMIEGMVAGLAERLERNPVNPDGWVRLVRAYIVLERRDDAIAAAGKALESLEDPAEVQNVKSAFESMGLDIRENGVQ